MHLEHGNVELLDTVFSYLVYQLVLSNMIYIIVLCNEFNVLINKLYSQLKHHEAFIAHVCYYSYEKTILLWSLSFYLAGNTKWIMTMSSIHADRWGASS